MPRFRIAPSLESQCLPVVAEMLWDWWLSSRDEHTSQVDQIIQYFQLPYRFTKKILAILFETHTVFTGHVLLLLKSGLSSFTLTRMYFVQFDILIQTAGSYMQKLTYLDLSRSRIPYEVLSATPKLIPNVNTLRLQSTTCKDDVVKSISDYCMCLEDLDISYCLVSDEGTAHLTAPNSQCRSTLKFLNITDTKVTINGAVFLLDELPNLEKFESHDMIDILSLAHSTYPNHIHSLRSFQFGSERRSNRAYLSNQIIVSHCYNIASEILPFLNQIIINDWNPQSPQGLRPICHYNCLSSLELDVEFCPFLTMTDIMPILATRGMQLEELILKQVQSIDPVVLIDSCTNLLTLELKNNSYIDSGVGQPFGEFTQLKNLILVGIMPAAVITVLMGYSPMLEYLDVHHSYNFTAEIIQMVLEKNHLSSLIEVWFLECICLTDDALQLLIASACDLQKISIEYCRVSTKEYNKLKQWIQRNYPCVDIELYCKSRIW